MMRWVAAAVAVLALAGCASPLPAAPEKGDYAVIISERLDSVWQQTGLPDELRPVVDAHTPAAQFYAAKAFAGCMSRLGWPNFRESDVGYSYEAIQLATSSTERLDWYRCYAENPVDSAYTMNSVAEFDFVYDYYQDTLIPCLAQNGHPIADAPSREEFRTNWDTWSDPLFPFVWNPYYEFEVQPDLYDVCPPAPPKQDFYEIR